MPTSARTRVSLPLRILQWPVDIGFIAAILGFVILFGLQFPHSAQLNQLNWVRELHRYGNPPIAGPAAWVRLNWPPASGFSFLPLGAAFVVWLLKIVADAAFLGAIRAIDKAFYKGPAATATAGWTGPGGVGAIAISTDSEEAREQLLKRYREIEQALKSAKRKHCTFLAVDVVGSTKMKLGEQEADIAATFQAYEEMLRTIFDQFGAWKQAWTPDGVMICFLQTDLALGAAKRILESMKKFNESENRLRTPFQVRCGLNTGEVPIFEDSKLEKIADRTIDVAGHIQKQSTPNTLWISSEAYHLLGDKSGFREASQEVDGSKVFEWSVGLNPSPSPN